MIKEYKKIIKSKSTNLLIKFIILQALVIFWNIFCYATKIESFMINTENINGIKIIDFAFGMLFSYLGTFLFSLFITGKKHIIEVSIISIPLTFLMILLANTGLDSIIFVVMLFYYLYCKDINITKSFVLFLIVLTSQLIFYYVKFEMVGIDYSTITNGLLRFLYSFDYYIFLITMIGIKERLISERG